MIYSKQRAAIMDALAGMHGTHPSADAIYAVLKADHPTMSLATVYRNLNQLADAGVIARVSMPDGANRFDDVPDGHLHMLCLNCGNIADIPREALGDLCARASQESGHCVEGCGILFYGVCNACKQAQQ